MKIHMDKILRECVENVYEDAHLRRIDQTRDRKAVMAEILSTLESRGDAMRYVDAKGRIAWKATPRLREYLADLEADAKADAEAEDL